MNPEFFKYCHELSVCLSVCLQVLVVNPEFFKYCHDHWTERHGRYPSTGLVALIFALHTCDQVPVCCTYCTCLAPVPTCLLFLPVSCNYLSYVPTRLLFLPVYCTCLSTVPTCLLHLPVYCTYLSIAPTCLLHRPPISTYLLILPMLVLCCVEFSIHAECSTLHCIPLSD